MLAFIIGFAAGAVSVLAVIFFFLSWACSEGEKAEQAMEDDLLMHEPRTDL